MHSAHAVNYYTTAACLAGVSRVAVGRVAVGRVAVQLGRPTYTYVYVYLDGSLFGRRVAVQLQHAIQLHGSYTPATRLDA